MTLVVILTAGELYAIGDADSIITFTLSMAQQADGKVSIFMTEAIMVVQHP